MKKEIEYGSILESNDKLFTGVRKSRKVVVTKIDKEDKEKVKKHVKKRGGKSNLKDNKKYKRK